MEKTTPHTDEYHCLREQAKRHALELRREAIREAHTWLANASQRWVGSALRRPAAQAAASSAPSPSQTISPCQPSF